MHSERLHIWAADGSTTSWPGWNHSHSAVTGRKKHSTVEPFFAEEPREQILKLNSLGCSTAGFKCETGSTCKNDVCVPVAQVPPRTILVKNPKDYYSHDGLRWYSGLAQKCGDDKLPCHTGMACIRDGTCAMFVGPGQDCGTRYRLCAPGSACDARTNKCKANEETQTSSVTSTLMTPATTSTPTTSTTPFKQ